MDEDDEGPKITCRKIKYLLLHFMPLLPTTLPSLCPHSHASCLPWLVVVLPLVLHRLSCSSCHHLPSVGTSTCPLLIVPMSLVVPLFFSGELASCPAQLFLCHLLSCHRLHLSSHCHLLLCPSRVSCLAGCRVASHHADASHVQVPPTLVALLPLFAFLS
jgi:hypothetical protein